MKFPPLGVQANAVRPCKTAVIPRPVGRRISEINVSRLRTGGHTASPLRILPCRRCRGRRGAAEPAPCGLRRDRQRANVGIGPYGRNGRKGFSPRGERERAAREEKLLDHPELFRAPIIRNGREATVGYKPEVWEKWE